jgi:oxygen-independent coproporphyrinogen-3 oxidase
MKGIYVHIPFCDSICHYCDFVKRVPKDKHMIDQYLKALREEILSYQKHFESIQTIYIGGGTPSMLDVNQLTYLFDSLKDITPVEYSIEVNPESYTSEKGKLFKAYGINRISLGVQTFNQELLTYLNRKHTKQQVFDVVDDLKKLDIKQISVDLIYAIPNQSMDDLKYDLEMIDQLNITHVSCYSLILEEKTYFYHQYLKGNFTEVDQDIEANMFKMVIDTLINQGFEHYEISNFQKNNHHSLHNLIYWTLGNYIGCGLGAHGFIDHMRTYNHRILQKYLINPLKNSQYQDDKTLLQDELIFGLRKIKGVLISELEEKYNIKLLDVYPKIMEKIDLGLVEIKNGYLRLTETGLFLGNQVFMVFI